MQVDIGKEREDGKQHISIEGMSYQVPAAFCKAFFGSGCANKTMEVAVFAAGGLIKPLEGATSELKECQPLPTVNIHINLNADTEPSRVQSLITAIDVQMKRMRENGSLD